MCSDQDSGFDSEATGQHGRILSGDYMKLSVMLRELEINKTESGR